MYHIQQFDYKFHFLNLTHFRNQVHYVKDFCLKLTELITKHFKCIIEVHFDLDQVFIIDKQTLPK